jgi:endonuclease YncB( thermonuclease family)
VRRGAGSHLSVVIATLLVVSGAHHPARAECALRKQAARTVVAVLDGQTIRLDDGREVRLAGVLAPVPPPGLAEGGTWAPAEAARLALDELVTGKTVRLAAAGRHKDRYGRQPAQVFLVEGGKEIWIEERLVTAGQARVTATAEGGRGCVAGLLEAEQTARRAKRGLWAHASYQVRDAAKAHELADFVQSFQIVEGRVKETGERKRRVYLDFGDVWKHDLTAIIAGRDRKRFEAAGIDLLKLKGRKVRLRGWVERWNGPLLRLSEPEQIEFLDKASDAVTAPMPPSSPIAIEPKAKSPG